MATKFPTFMQIPEDKIEETFQSQLDNLGVDYIDYYLLHNIQTINYDGYDGQGGGLAKLPEEAEAEQVNLFNGLDKQVVIASDGIDLTELVEKAVVWLTEHSF